MKRFWIFDMDGTLLDSMPIWDKVPEELLRRYGKIPAPDLRHRLISMNMEETARYLISEYHLPIKEDAFEDASGEAIRSLYKTVYPKEGVVELLNKLKEGGAKMCVCSATPQSYCREVLDRLGMLDRFEFILSEDEGYTKREPAIFMEALCRLGGTLPEEAVVCEDALHAAAAAHKAGFYVMVIEDASGKKDREELRQTADCYISSWRELSIDAL